MFYFFIIISFALMIILVLFSIVYINKLENKIDSLIDTFDEMDIVDVSLVEKKKYLATLKNIKSNKN